MNVIKRHKGLAIVCFLTLILVIVMALIFGRMIFSSESSAYGNRLDGIPAIADNSISNVVDKIKENDYVIDASVRIQGKIIYTTIKVNEGTDKTKVKELCTSTISLYSDEVVKAYDFGFFVKENIAESSEAVSVGYVLTGTKTPKNETISWNKE